MEAPGNIWRAAAVVDASRMMDSLNSSFILCSGVWLSCCFRGQCFVDFMLDDDEIMMIAIIYYCMMMMFVHSSSPPSLLPAGRYLLAMLYLKGIFSLAINDQFEIF